MKETSGEGEVEGTLDGGPGAAVANAFGFWLFPVDAFGALPENPDNGFRIEGPRIMDLTAHWPDLALIDLP